MRLFQVILLLSLASMVCTEVVSQLNNTDSNETIDSKLVYDYLIFQTHCVQMYNSGGMLAIPLKCPIYTISQILNLILLPLCLLLKIPQILLIYRNQSVFGLSYFGNNLQLLMTSMTLAYGLYANFSFWIYGENILLSIQNLAIIYMFFNFPLGNSKKQTADYQLKLIPYFITTVVISSIFVLQLVPDWCQEASIWLQLLVFLGARGSQIINNYKYKTTKNLSSKTVMTTLFANVARTITILVQSPGSIGYLLNYLIPIFVNGTIAAQIFYYKDKYITIEERQE